MKFPGTVINIEHHITEELKSNYKKYKKELESHQDTLEDIRKDADGHNVTLLYAAKDEKHNHAIVLKEVLEN